MKPNDLIDLIGIDQFEKVNVMYTDMYLSHAEDIRRCPNENCNYAGTIELKVCDGPLSCPECDYEWREYTQMSKYQKLFKSMRELISFNSETFSYMKEVLTGTPCPRCGMIIFKDGGCNHMNCNKCKYEFCWICLGHFPGYRHTENTYCPLRQFVTFVSLLTMLI